VKRLHILVGLFNLTALCVFAVAGITETFPRGERRAETQSVDYEAPRGLDDRQVADDFVSKQQIPLIAPLQGGAVHRNDENMVTFEFHSTNGPGKVTILEPQRKARIELSRVSFGRFMTEAHAATLRGSAPVLTMRLWALYVDCSIFSLLFMTLSGPWLWLTSRPELWWARIALAAGAGVIVFAWMLTR
jgi:hypothetical protein